MRKIVFGLMIVLVLGCAKETITNFEECINAGYPVMESYPRQCSDGSNTFVEIIISGITEEEAVAIAQNSSCIEEGGLSDKIMYNEFTRTWWIDMDIEKPGCAPACVVSEDSLTAEINWRCTGLLSEIKKYLDLSCQSSEDCDWIITNCCDEDEGAEWGCANKKRSGVDCPAGIVCDEEESLKPDSDCLCFSNQCRADVNG